MIFHFFRDFSFTSLFCVHASAFQEQDKLNKERVQIEIENEALRAHLEASQREVTSLREKMAEVREESEKREQQRATSDKEKVHGRILSGSRYFTLKNIFPVKPSTLNYDTFLHTLLSLRHVK